MGTVANSAKTATDVHAHMAHFGTIENLGNLVAAVPTAPATADIGIHHDRLPRARPVTGLPILATWPVDSWPGITGWCSPE